MISHGEKLIYEHAQKVRESQIKVGAGAKMLLAATMEYQEE